MTRVLIGISALMLAGCSMTPAYERPAAPVPATLPQGEAYAPRPAGAQAGLSLHPCRSGPQQKTPPPYVLS